MKKSLLLATDEMNTYPNAASLNLGTRVDYSKLIKIYTGLTEDPTRYLAGKCKARSWSRTTPKQ